MTHRFSVTLSFAPKRSSADERLGAKLRVTENRCVIFNPPTYVYICIELNVINDYFPFLDQSRFQISRKRNNVVLH